MPQLCISRSAVLPLLCGCLALLPTGCSMLNATALPFSDKEKVEYQTPRQMVPVWSDTVLHRAGEAATRGFGGRIMFYGPSKHQAIRVDGTLLVYAWDDSEGSLERAPDRKYVFPSESLQSHYSESRLGHSYSFWVPWDAAGGPLQHVTLISRFVSNDGTELTSSPAQVVLQGVGETSVFQDEVRRAVQLSAERTTESQVAKRRLEPSPTGIEQAGYESDQTTPTESRSSGRRSASHIPHPGLQSSEIGLTQGFYHRNMQGHQGGRGGLSEPLNAVDLVEHIPQGQSAEGQSLQSRNTSSARSVSSGESAAARVDAEHSDSEGSARGQSSPRLPPFQSRVRASRAVRPSDAHVRTEPLRAKWLNGLPKTPRSSAHAPE